MSSETPATHLARLRVQFGLHYRIEQARDSGQPDLRLRSIGPPGSGSTRAAPLHSKASFSIQRRAAE